MKRISVIAFYFFIVIALFDLLPTVIFQILAAFLTNESYVNDFNYFISQVNGYLYPIIMGICLFTELYIISKLIKKYINNTKDLLKVILPISALFLILGIFFNIASQSFFKIADCYSTNSCNSFNLIPYNISLNLGYTMIASAFITCVIVYYLGKMHLKK